MQRHYFDHNATTPVDPAALEAMAPALREAGSATHRAVHSFGQQARGWSKTPGARSRLC